MSPILEIPLALAAFLGHFSLAVWLFNRLHAVPWRVSTVKKLEKLLLLAAAVLVICFLVRRTLGHDLLTRPNDDSLPAQADYWAWLSYSGLCWIVAILVIPLWLIPKLLERTPAALVSNDTQVIDVSERLGHRPIHGRQTRLLASVPGNEIFRLHIQRKTLRLPSLPVGLAGLTIAHLSDLHMTGDLTEDFYREVVSATNSLQPDVVCITGDILEKTHCLPWITKTLGRLEARHGKFFILGNHERRLPDDRPLREALVAAGLTDLGSRCQTLALGGGEILLAGCELPWYGELPIGESSVGSRESGSQDPLRAPRSAFRILLSHTPDHFPWARRHGFDLMLAGHTHGGQIRLPGLGALISPSYHGWRYAGGLYRLPPTLLHVSRGLSGKHTIRLNCPPEIALLVLAR